MMDSDDSWLRSFILQYLKKIDYWQERFELSRDIEHLDRAELLADAVRNYLPKPLKELDLVGLRNLYWSLLSWTDSNEE